MPIDGYVEYQHREYCKDVACPMQAELDSVVRDSPEYESIRHVCRSACKHTTHEFHRWLIEMGYLIVRPEKQE